MKINNLYKLFAASAIGLGTAGTANEARANTQEQLPQQVQETNLQKPLLDKLEDKLYGAGIPGPHVPFIVLGIGAALASLRFTKTGSKVLNYPIIEVKEYKG